MPILNLSFLILGGYDLQDPQTPKDITDRLLSMLNQYLVSNQSLELNKSFQIYLKVLSVAHMQARQPKQAKRKFGQLHVGHTSAKETRHYWALDPPLSYPNEPTKNVFADKCLLISFIFGLLQNSYFFSNKEDKRYLKIQNVNSTVKDLKNSACKLLLNELECLMQTTKLQIKGPYHLQATLTILHDTYKCQIFVFDNVANSSKLCHMYPPQFQDELQPIYLYKSENNHIMFIRHLKAYFRKNYTICFGCGLKFKQPYTKHLCPKRATCFACRRPYSSNRTYLHAKLIAYYCDRFATKEIPQVCVICNCTLYSNHCLKGHKLLCNGQGRFGFKCLKECQKFFYCNNNTSQDIKNSHYCSTNGYCKYCKQEKESDHLCKLQHVRPAPYHSRLCFFKILFISNDFPLMAMFLKEEKERGQFTKFTFVNNIIMNSNNHVLTSYLNFTYFKPDTKYASFRDLLKKRPIKITEDFLASIRHLEKPSSFEDQILAFMLQQQHTSFICEDSSSDHLVSIAPCA